MEVVNPVVASLCNYEVLELLKDLESGQAGWKKSNKKQENLATICFETKKYLLGKTPCGRQSAEIVKSFLKALEPFNLTKLEKLQLLDLRPTTQVEIQVIVEESEERLSEEQVENLLEVIATVLPGEDDTETEECMETAQSEGTN